MRKVNFIAPRKLYKNKPKARQTPQELGQDTGSTETLRDKSEGEHAAHSTR